MVYENNTKKLDYYTMEEFKIIRTYTLYIYNFVIALCTYSNFPNKMTIQFSLNEHLQNFLYII